MKLDGERVPFFRGMEGLGTTFFEFPVALA